MGGVGGGGGGSWVSLGGKLSCLGGSFPCASLDDTLPLASATACTINLPAALSHDCNTL